MTESGKSLGKLISVHGIAPVYLQRAVFTVILSFLFFLGMMFAFYLRQSLGYFLLASAFLVVYLITMFSWVLQRKNVVRICEKGIEYRKFSAHWDEIETVRQTGDEKQIEITAANNRRTIIPSSIRDIGEIEAVLRRNVDRARSAA